MHPQTWVEVHTDALRANLHQVREHAQVPVCAVVKANGYGHGLVEAARTFLDAGAAMVAVSRLEEAANLRAAGIDGSILVLIPPRDLEEAIKLRVECMFDDIDRPIPAGAKLHLKVDLGMGRFGVFHQRAVEVASRWHEAGVLTGIATHLPEAARTSARTQLEGFARIVSQLRDAGITVPAHAANSAALLAHPGSRFDMVRVGTLLYGQDPPGVRAPWTGQETFAWFARVTSVRTLPAGSSVGYGREWTAERETRVATLPIGWADGFTLEPVARTPGGRETLARIKRALAARREDPRHVMFDDIGRVPVIGRVSMQTTTVIAADPRILVGSIARIPARRLTVSPAIPRHQLP